jgi:hypothetical protein
MGARLTDQFDRTFAANRIAVFDEGAVDLFHKLLGLFAYNHVPMERMVHQ